MPDVITEQRSFGQRLSNSFLGLIIGPILILVAIGLLWWNEGRAVAAIVGLNDAAGQVVEANASGPSPANAGKLVHVVGAATASSPISDSAVGTTFTGQVTVARTAEMYQWKESSHEDNNNNTTTYEYTRAWSEDPIDSSHFHYADGHENPAMPFASTQTSASDAKLGGWALDDGTLNRIDLEQSLNPPAPEGWSRDGNYLYRGNPASPKVGDMRVSYRGLASGTTISVLAQRSGNGFAAFTAKNGYTLELAAAGNHTAAELIERQGKAEAILTWVLRAVGWLLIFMGFTAFLSPLSAMASFVPILGGIVRGAAAGISFVISVPL